MKIKEVWVDTDWAKTKDSISHIFEVQKKEITPYIDIYGMVELAELNLKQDYGDELPDDWEICGFNEKEILEELGAEINEIFKKWLKKYDRLPNIYKIKEIRSTSA